MTSRIRERLGFSASADNSRQPQQAGTRDRGAVRHATTISFTAPGTIADSGNGFGFFRPGDCIQITGGTNRGFWVVAAAAAGSLTVRPGRITTASAGPAVTVRKA